MSGAAWVVCPFCRLRHSVRADGLCPRCRQPGATGAAPASPGGEPLPSPAPPPPPPPKVPFASGIVVIALVSLGITAHLALAADPLGRLSRSEPLRDALLLGELALLVAWVPWLVWILAVGDALRTAGARGVPSSAWIAGSFLVPAAPVTHYLVLGRLARAGSQLSGRREGGAGALALALPGWWFGGLAVAGLVWVTSPLLSELVRLPLPHALHALRAGSPLPQTVVRLLAAAWGTGTLAIVCTFHGLLRDAGARALAGEPVTSSPSS